MTRSDLRLPCRLLASLVLTWLVLAPPALAQEGVDLSGLEIFNTGVPDAQPRGIEPAVEAAKWSDTLGPAFKLGITAVAVGVPMLVIILGRLWRRLPESERVLILLCAAMGRGRGFRNRVKSLGGAVGPGGRPVTPVAMLLSPRAFDTALTSATHAERAYGQPLRHAVHGFRKG